MLIKDLKPYMVFDLNNFKSLKNNDIFILNYNKIHKRTFLLLYTGYQEFYFIIPKSKLFYNNIRLKVYADESIIKKLIYRDNINSVINKIKSKNFNINDVKIRYVNINRFKISRLKEVKDLLKTLDFNNSYICEYNNHNSILWYTLKEDGLYLNNSLCYSTINNNDNHIKADFNMIINIQKVDTIYTYNEGTETNTKLDTK